MKSSLLGMFLVWHGALAQYVEPPWWPLIESSFDGVRLSRCNKRTEPPPNGQSCARRPKTCFFGSQDCYGAPYPDTKCFCNFRTWQCEPVLCPGEVAPTQPPAPSQCYEVRVDFETRGNESVLEAGDYISTEWSDQHFFLISATTTSGYTPNNMPRLFDTANPGTVAEGDPDLGSPNQLCLPSGPGVGDGGEPNTPGENCDPQGLVLIIQESQTDFPDDNAEGGTIIFDFIFAADVKSVGLMDIEPGPVATFISVKNFNGVVFSFDAQGYGDNSVEDVTIDVMDVLQLNVTFATSGAVTYLDFCPGKVAQTLAPSASPASAPPTCPSLGCPDTTLMPSSTPSSITARPSRDTSSAPSEEPSSSPASAPPTCPSLGCSDTTLAPSSMPSYIYAQPSRDPSAVPSTTPSADPTPLYIPPTQEPTCDPAGCSPPVTPEPTCDPTGCRVPTPTPTRVPSTTPSAKPTPPYVPPTEEPTCAPEGCGVPTPTPTPPDYVQPTPEPTPDYIPPTPEPTLEPTPEPTPDYVPPTLHPTPDYVPPTAEPTQAYVPPTPEPTPDYARPTPEPTCGSTKCDVAP